MTVISVVAIPPPAYLLHFLLHI